jgi:ribosomal protein S12 methylthiotransferase accessory factor
MEMQITFPGGARVRADFGDYSILTDQPADKGGDGSAPAPFDHFLASIGTCAGFFVNKFLTQRKLSTEGVSVVLRTTRDPETRMVTEIELDVVLPDDFPEKYERAIVNSVNLCSVKKHLLTPPRFTTTVTRRSLGGCCP